MIRLAADIGGTFTDLVLDTGEGLHTRKVLTTHTGPERAVIEGAATLLREAGLLPADVGLFLHGTTLATNALIERRGAATALLTTAGFRDTLELGTESRFDQYDLNLRKPPALVPRQWRLTVPERMAADGAVLLALDEDAVRAAGREMQAGSIASVAICFLHSYANPAHERRAAAILADEVPELRVSFSAEVSPEIREWERFTTTAANAYVQPIIASYLERMSDCLAAEGYACPLFLMLSSGDLTTVGLAKRFPVRLVESGPAGGAVFAAEIARARRLDRVLSFDMGGTTAKLCLIDDGVPLQSPVFEVARTHRHRKGSGLPLRIPVVEMVEIGAGGGSIAARDALGRIQVGPESAGSEPGPACYGRGGERPTVSDADLMLGRLDPTAFAGGRIALDIDRAAKALAAIDADPVAAAYGVVEIVDEAMTAAARVHAVEQGTEVESRTMIAFGGAAPLHAVRLAEKLGIGRVVVPRHAGVGSAVGFLRAPMAFSLSRSLPQKLAAFDAAAASAVLAELAAEARSVVQAGAPGETPAETRQMAARYAGQGQEIVVKLPDRPLHQSDGGLLREAFERAYTAQYGRGIPGMAVEILTWSVRVAVAPAATETLAPHDAGCSHAAARSRAVFDPASATTYPFGVLAREALAIGEHAAGPVLITETETTTVVPPRWRAHADAGLALVIERAP